MLENQKRTAYIEGFSSVGLNTVLFGLKFWAGRYSGSVAQVADAWHTLSDTATSFVVILGVWIASRPRDKEHPFGHGQAEIIGAIVIGTLLAVVGFTFLKESLVQLREQNVPVFSTFALVVFAASAFLKEGLAQYAIRAGRRIGSRSLVADGWHHRSDAIASVVIVAGALLGGVAWWIDGVLGLMVSGLILYTAFDIIRDSARPLMGESPTRQTVEAIRSMVRESAPDVVDVHHVHVHTYGSHSELTLHVRVPGDLSIDEAHDTSSRIEHEIRTRLGMEATIHVEPWSLPAKEQPQSP